MLKQYLTFKNLFKASGIVVILKIIYILLIQDKIFGIEDFTIAKNIVNHHQYSEFFNLGGTAFKLPVYPYLISIFIWFLGDKALLGLAIFQAVLSFFSPIIIYRILKLFSQEKVGILAGFLFLLSPSYFVYSANIEATNIFISILLLWFYCYFTIWNNKQTAIYLFSFGILTALLFLTQVVIVPLAVLMLIALIILKKLNIRRFILLITVAAIFYSPWVIRNYLVFDRVILSKTPAWQNIYYGFTPNGQLLNSLKLVSKQRDHNLYQMRDEVDELTMEKIYKNEVKKVTEWKPYYFLKKGVSNFVCLYFVPPKYFYDNSLSVVLGRKMYVLIINALSLVALVLLYKRDRNIFFFSLLFFGNFTFPYLIGHAGNIRFKLDFEWYQLILIAYFIIELSNKQQKRRIL
ncbi:ArnT family glycosyltransferase [Epilithonimonas arachidiradicis]|uniref:Dolichyl-phosphate-mannose-protein mannosyltransferase n=1 Tax=Epilithonimonas arachidiradicis TaxID=1617282 RepID=A0A420D824_9FLAO|nr:glycosyltransferase family 39 protein [Epilithonimonas arachidiradicis]RKE86858.1 dolichyl-phosphate-mannose-protein mannosyltransferase [Epilithonimonas arachidiradicis]GGG61509.1 hypothetical protein GCM10007332_24270 [Epilithonimonas arachidiradicis]